MKIFLAHVVAMFAACMLSLAATASPADVRGNKLLSLTSPRPACLSLIFQHSIGYRRRIRIRGTRGLCGGLGALESASSNMRRDQNTTAVSGVCCGSSRWCTLRHHGQSARYKETVDSVSHRLHRTLVRVGRLLRHLWPRQPHADI